MSDVSSFRELMGRVRAGDAAAAAELVTRYEPAIRRAARARLGDARLRRIFDSQDVCQSVFASFFVRVALEQFELERPEQLLKLLTTMARNKTINEIEKQRAGRRDHRRMAEGSDGPREAVAPGPSPSEHVAVQELAREARRRLTPADRQLLDLRDQGLEWAEIARIVGGSAEALRKQLARAVERVARQLGLDDAQHE